MFWIVYIIAFDYVLRIGQCYSHGITACMQSLFLPIHHISYSYDY